MSGLQWLLLVTLSVLWGGSFLFSKVALAELGPLTVAFGRVSIAALALNLLLLTRGQHLPATSRLWIDFLLMAMLNNVLPFSLIFYGQTQIASGVAAILNATTPLFAVVLAHVLTDDERLTRGRILGVVFGLGGVTVMVGVDALAGLGLGTVAQIAVLGAALSYACAGLFGRRFRGVPPLVTAAGQLTASSIVLVPVALLVDHPWTLAMPSPGTWAALIGLALLSTAVAYVIYFRILAAAGATNLLLVTFLIPVTALLLGITFLHETLAARHIAGMLLIGFGLAAIDGRPNRLLRRLIADQTSASR